jgi:Flp pilus assembly protein TadD
MGTHWRRGVTGLIASTVVGSTIGCHTPQVVDRNLIPSVQSSADRIPPRAPNLTPERTAQLAFATAVQMEKGGHTKVAAEQYEKARQLDPKLTEVAHRLAVLYDREGDFARASTEFKKALEARPKDPDLLNDVAYHCYQRGDWSGAETRLRQALSINAKHERAWINLGMTLAQEGKVQEAFKAFTKVISPAEAKSNLGMILAQNGRYDDAKQAFRESLEMEPDAPRTRAALAQLEKKEPGNGPNLIGSKAPSPAISAN